MSAVTSVRHLSQTSVTPKADAIVLNEVVRHIELSCASIRVCSVRRRSLWSAESELRSVLADRKVLDVAPSDPNTIAESRAQFENQHRCSLLASTPWSHGRSSAMSSAVLELAQNHTECGRKSRRAVW